MNSAVRMHLVHRFTVLALILTTVTAGAAPEKRGALRVERRGHTATLLDDGRVLIVGGENGAGVVAQVETLDAGGRSSLLHGRAIAGRTEHTATKLADGRVLIIGGRDGVTRFDSTEIYANGAFHLGPALGQARSGHSATTLRDGRIVVAGGDAAGTIEIYDPAEDCFVANAARLTTARSVHGAVALKDGKVLIVGGRDAEGAALRSAEIFDPATGTVMPAGEMKSARISPVLNLLFDGKLQVIGGDGAATLEMYNPEGRYFTAFTQLITRTTPIEKLLGTPARAGFIDESERVGTYTRGHFASGMLDRSGSASVIVGGTTLITGGTSGLRYIASSVAVESSTAAITTDKTDYAPGETVTITGTGFGPNEVVKIVLERNPETEPATTIESTTDSDGNFVNSDYVCQLFDANVTFTATATGQTSGLVATTSFTDSVTAASVTAEIRESTCTTATTSFSTGTSVCARSSVTATSTPSNDYVFLWFAPASATPTRTSSTITAPSGTSNATDVLPGSSVTTAGTWTLKICRPTNCSGSNELESQTFTVTAPIISTSLTVQGATDSYGGSVNLTATISPVVSGKSISFTLNGNSVGSASTNASGVATLNNAALGSIAFGVYPTGVGASFAGDGTHGASSGTASLTVNKAVLTVTADDASREYGEANPSFTYVISGYVNSEDATSAGVTGTASCSSTAGATSAVPGPYAITCTAGSLAAANYSFTSFVDGDLTITRAALTVTAEDKSRAYGAADPPFTTTFSGFKNGETASVVSGTASCTTTATATSAVSGSPYAISCTAGSLSATNYSFGPFVDGDLDITPATLTVTADDASREYGEANPSFTYVISGYVNSEDATSAGVTGTASCSSTAGATSAVPGPYPITCTAGSLAAANYSFTSFVDGDLTVTTAALTVTAEDKSRAYGAADPPFTTTFSGFKNGETASVVSGTASCTTTATATSPVAGSPYAISCTAGSLSATNYSFGPFVDGDLDITPATLTVTADDASREYGEVNPSFTYVISGYANSEDATSAGVAGTASCSSTAGATSAVPGPYVITCTAGSLAAANYSFTSFVDGDLTITRAALTATAEDKSRAYGAADPPFTTTFSGFKNGETASVVSGTASCTTTATATSAVSGSPYAISCTAGSLSATNYSFGPFVDGDLDITPATPSFSSLSSPSIAFGSTPTAVGGHIEAGPSLYPTGDVTITINGDVQQATIDGSGNFSVSFNTGALTVAGSAYTISYDYPGDANFSGAVGSGTLTVSPATTATSISVSPASVQFTDTITLSATVLPAVTGTVTFQIGSTTVASAVPVVAGVAGPVTVQIKRPEWPVGTYTATASFTSSDPNYSSSTSTDVNNLGVTAEDPLVVEYTGDTIIFTTANSANVALRATITQPPATDSDVGDFNLLNTGGNRLFADFYIDGSLVASVPVQNSSSTPGVGVATTTISKNTASYAIEVRVRQTQTYWDYATIGVQQIVATDSNSLTIANSTGPNISGGGWVPDSSSTNGKTNFGFTIKFNKQLTNLQGNSVNVFKTTSPAAVSGDNPAGEVNIQVKTNKLVGLGIEIGGLARLTAKANVEVTDAVTGAVVETFGAGNITNFQLAVTDNPDHYGMLVRRPDGTIFKSIGTVGANGKVSPIAIGKGEISVKTK